MEGTGTSRSVVNNGSEQVIVAPLSEKDLAESMIFYRRRLAQKIIEQMIAAAPHGVLDIVHSNPAAVAEDLANAICERLAARETGKPEGYGRP